MNGSNGTGLTIGFITNVYARASDTFIRGEVRELRRIGHTVHTFSIRKAEEERRVAFEWMASHAGSMLLS